MVARFVPENSVEEFLGAAERLSAKYKIVIVGSSGYGGEIEAKVREVSAREPNVLWLGHLSDDARLLSLWQHSGVYFHGHSVGGTNPALVQAMAVGAPVVARDTVYNREVLADAGTFCEPTSESIYEAINELMSHPTAMIAFSERARRRALEDYSWEMVNGAYERLPHSGRTRVKLVSNCSVTDCQRCYPRIGRLCSPTLGSTNTSCLIASPSHPNVLSSERERFTIPKAIGPSS